MGQFIVASLVLCFRDIGSPPTLLYNRLTEIKVFQEGETRISPFYDFDKAGLHPVMRRNVDLAGYKVPTPIQMYCLPAVIHGHDVMGIAQTGM